MSRILDPQFKKTVKNSVSNEIYNMLHESYEKSINERLDDKMSARWDNVKTGVGNIGRAITGQDTKTMVDVNAHSQKMNQSRANKKSNAKLQKVQKRVNRRFDSNIAPILQRSGVESSGVKQELNKAIAANMKDDTTPNMEASRKPKGGQHPAGQNTQPAVPAGQNTGQKEIQRKPLVLNKNNQQGQQPKNLNSTLIKKNPQAQQPKGQQKTTQKTGGGSGVTKPVVKQTQPQVKSEQRLYNTVKSLLRN